MLEEIRIRSLGVIDSSTLELGPGLTVITGETGAGKTMVVTALGLLLGGRADTGAVRNGSMAETVYPAHALMTELVKDPFSVDKKGEIELPDTPGLGIELDPKIVKKYRVKA